MQKHARWLAAIAALALTGLRADAQPASADRLYVMDCAQWRRRRPIALVAGVNVGKPIELSDNCYLIKHGADWLLWEHRLPDALAQKPSRSPTGTATRAKTLGPSSRRSG
jgi:hypothetical protein